MCHFTISSVGFKQSQQRRLAEIDAPHLNEVSLEIRDEIRGQNLVKAHPISIAEPFAVTDEEELWKGRVTKQGREGSNQLSEQRRR